MNNKKYENSTKRYIYNWEQVRAHMKVIEASMKQWKY